MEKPFFVHGKLHTPFYVFIRSAGAYSDADLLRHFGLSAYRRTTAPLQLGRYAILADDGPWTMIADDWYYTLWHTPSTRPAIAALGERHDVFACSVGDCDHSFDFDCYRDGRLARRYVVVDPDFQRGRVVENVGAPLPGEATAFALPGELQTVLEIARSLGIKTEYAEDELRVYAP
jgi:hypothetical protein